MWTRRQHWVAFTTLSSALLGTACSSDSSAPDSDGTGGSSGTTGQGGSAGSGATGGSAGTGGTGTGGAGATGGSAGTGGSGTGGSGAIGGAGGGSGGSGTGGATGGSGATSGVGGGGTAGTGATSGVGGSGGTGGVGGSLLDRIRITDITAPEGVKAGTNNWRIWGTGSLKVAPVFTVPLADGGTLVGYTTGDGTVTARAAHLDANSTLIATHDLGAARELRGLAAEPDGHFAALLWNETGTQIFVTRFDAAGAAGWTTELLNADNKPTDFGIGESRLEFGGGKYGAYYHVHSDSGHEGDTLKWVDAAVGTETTEWGWGCSHSMSNLLRFNTPLAKFLPMCVTDCYPGTSGDFATESIGGIYVGNGDAKVMDVDAGCNGSVAGELGGAAIAPNGWHVVFNAHQAPATKGQSSYDEATMNQDIGVSALGADFTPGPVVWLTTTPTLNEADSGIERWEPAGDPSEQYVVGWSESEGATHQLARLDPAGAMLEGPVDVSAVAHWGRRDDPFRVHTNHDIVWGWFDDAGSTTLHFARLVAAGPRR